MIAQGLAKIELFFLVQLIKEKKIKYDFFLKLYYIPAHCCIVVYINVIQQQTIFFSWMYRPSDDRSRRISPVQFWELLHTFEHFFSEIET